MGLACLTETEVSDLVKSATTAKDTVCNTSDIVRQGFAANANKEGRDKFFADKEKEVRAIHDKLKAAGANGVAQEKLLEACEKQEIIDAKEQERILDVEATSHIFRIAQNEFIRDASEKLLNARRVDDKTSQSEMITSLREVAGRSGEQVKRFDELSKAVNDEVAGSGANPSFEQLKKIADKQSALNEYLIANPDLIRVVAARSLLQKLNVPLSAKAGESTVVLPEQGEIEKIKLAADAELEKVKLRLEQGLVARKTDIGIKENTLKEQPQQASASNPNQNQDEDQDTNGTANKTKTKQKPLEDPEPKVKEKNKNIKNETLVGPTVSTQQKKIEKPKHGLIVFGALNVDFENTTGGVKLTDVAADGASAEFLKVGDILTSFKGKPIKDENKLLEYLGHSSPGEKAEIGFIRGGKSQTATVTLGSREMAVGLGLTYSQWRYMLTSQNGVNIEAVNPKSPIASQINPGDVIMKVNGEQVTSPAHFQILLSEAFEKGGAVNLYVRRKTFLPPGIGGTNEDIQVRTNSMLGWEDTAK